MCWWFCACVGGFVHVLMDLHVVHLPVLVDRHMSVDLYVIASSFGVYPCIGGSLCGSKLNDVG